MQIWIVSSWMIAETSYFCTLNWYLSLNNARGLFATAKHKWIRCLAEKSRILNNAVEDITILSEKPRAIALRKMQLEPRAPAVEIALKTNHSDRAAVRYQIPFAYSSRSLRKTDRCRSELDELQALSAFINEKLKRYAHKCKKNAQFSHTLYSKGYSIGTLEFLCQKIWKDCTAKAADSFDAVAHQGP